MTRHAPIEDYFGTEITVEPIFKSSGLFVYLSREWSEEDAQAPGTFVDAESFDRFTPEQARELGERLIEASGEPAGSCPCGRTPDPGIKPEGGCRCTEEQSEETEEIHRELLLAVTEEWTSTRDLATMVGVGRFGDLGPVRVALYKLRAEGRVELRRRGGSHGYLWRKAGASQ